MSGSVLSPLEAAALLAGRRGRVVLHAPRSDDIARGPGPDDDGGGGGGAFVTAGPHATLIGRGRSLVLLDAAGRPARRFTGDPLEAAEAFLAEHGCGPDAGDGDGDGAGDGDGDATVRVLGYFAYDLARVFEPLPGGAALAPNGPDLWLAAYGAAAQWSADGALTIAGSDGDARAELAEALGRPARPLLAPALGALAAIDDDAHHLARIERLRDHLATGEIERVHLARRLTARIAAPGDALAVLAALVTVPSASSAFHALLEIDGTSLLVAAGEPMLRIARAAAAPSALAPSPAAVLRARFPDDTVTGAPRLRAMQLIDELEPSRRGPYGGALGRFAAGGACDLVTATAVGVLAQSELRVCVGSTIAAGSDPVSELAITERAAAPWHAALAELTARSGSRT